MVLLCLLSIVFSALLSPRLDDGGVAPRAVFAFLGYLPFLLSMLLDVDAAARVPNELLVELPVGTTAPTGLPASSKTGLITFAFLLLLDIVCTHDALDWRSQAAANGTAPACELEKEAQCCVQCMPCWGCVAAQVLLSSHQKK